MKKEIGKETNLKVKRRWKIKYTELLYNPNYSLNSRYFKFKKIFKNILRNFFSILHFILSEF